MIARPPGSGYPAGGSGRAVQLSTFNVFMDMRARRVRLGGSSLVARRVRLGGSSNRADYAPVFFAIFAHVSFNVTVRLNTSLPAVESGSTKKYPCRSN